MGLSNWPTLVDDDGSLTLGTEIDKAVFDSIKASIEDDLFSAANPTITAEDIIDEVKNARGSKASLDARLDVVLNEDGTLKSSAGLAEDSDLMAVAGAKDWYRNGNLELWTAGTTAAPDYFVLTGAGATIAQDTFGVTGADTGTSARVTAGAGAAARLTQVVLSAAEITAYGENLKGRKVAIGARVRVAASGVIRFVVEDGINTTTGDYVTGDAAVQQMSVLHTFGSGAITSLTIHVEIAPSGVASFGGLNAILSNVLLEDWIPAPDSRILRGPMYQNIGHGAATQLTGRTMAFLTGEFGYQSPNTSENTALTFTLPARAMTAFGHVVMIQHFVKTAANANTKVIKIVTGGTSNTVYTGAANNKVMSVTIWIYRSTAGVFWVNWVVQENGVAPSVGGATGTVDSSADRIVNLNYLCATAAADLLSYGTTVWMAH